MTCDEFRRVIETDVLQSTAGLRASVYKHANECVACQERMLLDELLYELSDHPPISPEQAEILDELTDRDWLDQEVRETVFGKLDAPPLTTRKGF